MKKLRTADNLDLCYKNTCIKASGRNAKILTNILSFAMIVVTVSTLVKASNG